MVSLFSVCLSFKERSRERISNLAGSEYGTMNYLVPRRLSAEKTMGAQGRKGTRKKQPRFFFLPVVPCASRSSPVARASRSALRARHAKRLRRRLMHEGNGREHLTTGAPFHRGAQSILTTKMSFCLMSHLY